MRMPITKKGMELLRQELETLKQIERPNIIRAIADARSYGDIRENAEYHAAKEQQSFVEGRIAELGSKLANMQVIDIHALGKPDKVTFGATVALQKRETEELLRYQIVGEEEANLKRNQISVSSPTARAIMNRRKGEWVTVMAPRGEVEYQIVEIAYLE